MKARSPNRRSVFKIPLMLAGVTLLGLVSGLVGDGAADLLAWLALGSCLAVIGWFLARA